MIGFHQALLAAADSGSSVLWTFLLYMVGVFVIAGLSNRLLKNREFLSEYFLGSRGLGVWAFALTLAATSSSGGSFMGFPSKIYTHGWSLGLWIGSYMVVPVCVMGILGKRINEVARTAEAITIPDVLRDRFRSVSFGLISVSLIVFFMTVQPDRPVQGWQHDPENPAGPDRRLHLLGRQPARLDRNRSVPRATSTCCAWSSSASP